LAEDWEDRFIPARQTVRKSTGQVSRKTTPIMPGDDLNKLPPPSTARLGGEGLGMETYTTDTEVTQVMQLLSEDLLFDGGGVAPAQETPVGSYISRYTDMECITDGAWIPSTSDEGFLLGFKSEAGDEFQIGTTGDNIYGSLMIRQKSATATDWNPWYEIPTTMDVAARVENATGLEKIKLTPEGGYAVKLTNKTGADSIKGTLVTASPTINSAFSVLPGLNPKILGVVYDDGVADGDECFVVVGGIAEVLLADGEASTNGHYALANGVAGRVRTSATLLAASAIVGLSLEYRTPGTDQLLKVALSGARIN
jgi:hypothetical protein